VKSLIKIILIIIVILFMSGCRYGSSKHPASPIDSGIHVKELESYPQIPGNALNGITETLELDYMVWGCSCANWISPVDRIKYENDHLDQHCIFLEPAVDSLSLPVYFQPERHRVRVTGQFYKLPCWPKGEPKTEEQLAKAPVFHYTSIQVLQSPEVLETKKDTTISVWYGGVACHCAQWVLSETGIGTDNDKYTWLEKGKEDLIDADTLYDGTNFPIHLRLKGHFVSESGLPTGYILTYKGDDPGFVFRYTSIRVLKRGDSKISQ